MPLTEHNLLRVVGFRPYRKGMGPMFKLTTWDTGRTVSGGKSRIGYCLSIKHERTKDGRPAPSTWKPLFEGEDFGCSPLHAIDSDACVAGIMTSLTLRPGDTDREYFEDYTPEQMAYCSEHAEALSAEVCNRFGDR